jgi:acetoin utilization protein AcuB
MSAAKAPSLLVRDWMHARPIVAHPKDSIDRARALCEEHRINQLPVVSGKDLVGIITDRDLRDAFPSVADQARDPLRAHAETAAMTVEEVMTPQVLTVADSDTVEHVARLMQIERIGALPVLRDGAMVGLVTRSDLLRALIAYANHLAR